MKKKQKGFTIVEVLTIVVILAIIALIAVPVGIGVIRESRRKAYDATCDAVERAAELYFLNERGNRINVGQTIELDLNDFKEYLTDTKLVQWNYKVTVSRTNNGTTFYYQGRGANLKEVYQ